MALSFLYLAFIRTLQLLRLHRSRRSDLAVEVVLLRHEVAVLRRQVARPALLPADRALVAGLRRLLLRLKRHHLFVQPDTLQPPVPEVVAKQHLKNVNPSRLNRTNRSGGVIHEYRLVA